MEINLLWALDPLYTGSLGSLIAGSGMWWPWLGSGFLGAQVVLSLIDFECGQVGSGGLL